ncbi:hypothetical protein ACK3TF_002942 [Chlorella vulgaris]
MAIDSTLASFLDLLALLDEPTFRWGPAELRAAFQWGSTLQQLLGDANAAAIVRLRLQDVKHQLPAGLQALLPVIGRQPLQLTLERLLLRNLSTTTTQPVAWLEAVLAAYIAAVVLPSAPEQQKDAERQLIDTLSRLQQQAAVQGILQQAAQQAAAAAAAQLGSRRGCGNEGDNPGDASLRGQEAQQQQQLKEEALRYLTSPACLELAAVAQLLTQRAQHAEARQPVAELAEQHQDSLAALLHSPATELELELLCWVALLPGWEAALHRLAGFGKGALAGRRSSSDSALGESKSSRLHTHAAQQQAMQLLCGACACQPQALLRRCRPELLAEVCRQSFRFTCGYAALLQQQQRAAAEGTEREAAAAKRHLAHATKHCDHVSQYLRAKCCC